MTRKHRKSHIYGSILSVVDISCFGSVEASNTVTANGQHDDSSADSADNEAFSGIPALSVSQDRENSNDDEEVCNMEFYEEQTADRSPGTADT